MNKEELISKIITYNYDYFGNEFGNCLVDMERENRELKKYVSLILNKVSTIEHNLEKYEEIGIEEHFDYALHKTWELKNYLFDLLNEDKEKE